MQITPRAFDFLMTVPASVQTSDELLKRAELQGDDYLAHGESLAVSGLSACLWRTASGRSVHRVTVEVVAS